MAAPRRALAQTLLRASAQPAVRAARPCASAALASTSRAVPAWQARRGALSTQGLRWYSAKNESISKIYSFEDIKKQVEDNDAAAEGDRKVVFVDVREPSELLETGRIPGAINIPITTAVQSFHISDEDFVDLYGFDRPAKDEHLVFYCKAGVRARSAAGLAQHAGWTSIGEYPGSWLDWAEQKGPVEVRVKPTGDEWARRED